MKKHMKSERGFTLIEMLVVLMVISLLLLIAVPNMTKNNDVAAEKGCEATKKLIETQAHAYELEEGTPIVAISDLEQAKYVDRVTCPNGDVLEYDTVNKKVILGS